MSLSKSNGSNSNRKSRIRDKIKDNSNVFMKMLIDFKVPLEYRYVNRLLTENILEYLNKRFAGKCCEQGYIQPDSISIVNYSSGIVKNNIIIFDVVFECQVCYLVEGQEVNCIAKNITKAGIRAEFDMEKTPAVIFVARDHHYVNQEFNDVKESDSITVKIIGQRFELNDTNISAIAELVKINRAPKKLTIKDEIEEATKSEEPEPEELEEPEEQEQVKEEELVKEPVEEPTKPVEEPIEEPVEEPTKSVKQEPVEEQEEPVEEQEEPVEEPTKLVEEPVKQEPVEEPDDQDEAALKALEMLDREIEQDIHKQETKPEDNVDSLAQESKPEKAITITPDTKTPVKKPRGRPKKNP